MAFEFKLPDIGEGIAEGEIVKWLVAPGDVVNEDDPVVEVMTDKATVEIPSPKSGKILELKVKEGQVVPIGSVIFSLDEGSGGSSEAPATDERQAAPSAPATAKPPNKAHAAASAGSSNGGAVAAPPRDPDAKVLAVPSARRLARELGVDIRQVPGSGRHGTIRRTDVEAFAASGAPATPAPARPATAGTAPAAAPTKSISFATYGGDGPPDERIPFRGVRKITAEAMIRSKHTAAHFTVVEEVDVTDLVKLRETAKEMAAEYGIKFTYMPFIMKAVASGLAQYPQLNSTLDEKAQEIVIRHQVHLGIATDTPNGLLVPVVRHVERKGMLQLAAEVAEVSAKARSGKAKPEDLKGSTFSITNAGNIGGILATPVINFPEVAILGVHRIVRRPGVVGDQIVPRDFMNLSISVDHRLVDGADAARFLVHLKRLLENPGLLAF